MRKLPLVFVLALVLTLAFILPAAADEPPGYKPKVLGTSLRDQALAALSAAKLPEAAALYRRWLQADPQDGDSWYNLACALALDGKKDDALTAFETSIDAGFDDLGHAGRDMDLASIRDDKRFVATVKRGAAKKAAAALPGMKRHALTTTTIGSYIVLLPPDYETSKASYPVVFILHGSGSTEVRHARVAKTMGREGVIYVAPRALHPHKGVFLGAGQAGWTAWPPEQSPADEAKPGAMVLYTDWILRCAKDVKRRYRVKGARIHAWGHSQGAGTATCLASLHPKQVASYFAYAGYYPGDIVTDASIAALKTHGVHVELCHGTNDRVVQPGPTLAMKGRLATAGVSSAVHMIDAEHGLTEEVGALSKAWVDKHVRATSKVAAKKPAKEEAPAPGK